MKPSIEPFRTSVLTNMEFTRTKKENKHGGITSLDLVFEDLILFIDELIKDYGEPIRPTHSEIEKLKQQIIDNPANNNPRLQKNFFVIERVDGEVLFAFNVDKYLGLEGNFDLKTLFSCVDDGSGTWNYLKDYLSWAKCAYLFARNIFKDIDIDRFAFKIRIPMRCRDGRFYWVLKEVRPLETDQNNNLISHLNTYTISNLYKEKFPVSLIGELYFDDAYQDEWNKIVAEARFSMQPFILTPVQKDILDFFYNHSDATIKTCAAELKYPVNTLKKYISDCQHKHGIIDKAKVSFPRVPASKLKDVVDILEKIGWFQ